MNIQEDLDHRSSPLQDYQLVNQNMRTFAIEQEETHRSVLIDHILSFEDQQIDLYSFFEQYCPLKTNKLFIYDPDINKFVSFSKIGADLNGKLPKCLFSTKIIMIRFRKREEEGLTSESDSGFDSNYEETRQKKDRSKERTIGETIQIVKQWRILHLNSLKSGLKKMSLLEVAKIVGVSKKSLDDYYYQLRLGEFYRFDFSSNLDEKVGILRAFVKEFKPERDQKNKNTRHPKNLKIIEEFDINNLGKKLVVQPDVIPETQMKEIQSPCSMRSIFNDEESLQSLSNPFEKDISEIYEDKFFKNFEFLMDDPSDPFIQTNRDFKKKICEQPSCDYFQFF